MVKRTRRAQRGAGVMTPQQFFDPAALGPAAASLFGPPSSAPTSLEIRPVLASTFQSGGRRARTRRSMRGGFVPSVMGAFAANAQAAIVPLAMYLVYHTMVPKSNKSASSTRRRRSSKRV